MLEHLNDFIVYLASEKGLSANTLEAYRRDVFAFFHFLQEHPHIQSWNQVDRDQIIAFLSQKKEAKYATSSLCRFLVAIKVLFRFLKREGVVIENSAALLETPKLEQLLPDILSPEEIELLLSVPDVSTKRGARDRAILEVLYASGLRVSELCRLKISDVDNHYVRVFGKGGKERLVPIGKQAIKAIDRYLCFRDGPETSEETALFVSRGGKPMNRIAVWKQVKLYAARANIRKRISPHTFRHSFATHLLDNGADLRVIQEMLGHTNIQSTDRYTRVSLTHLREAFEASHPRHIISV